MSSDVLFTECDPVNLQSLIKIVIFIGSFYEHIASLLSLLAGTFTGWFDR